MAFEQLQDIFTSKDDPSRAHFVYLTGNEKKDASSIQINTGNLQLAPLGKGLLSPQNASESAWMEDAWGELIASSPAKQVAVGGVAGWCTGYVVAKVGKIILFAFGGSVIILQIAQSQGLVQINWKAIESKVSKTQTKMKKEFSDKLPHILEQVKEHSKRYVYLSGSFCAGLFLGIFF